VNVIQAAWQDERTFLLRVVQPALVGLIDGTVSTLAPIFAAAFLAGSHAALLVGLATAVGAGISMGLSEGLSDDGTLTGRGSGEVRGAITGLATTFGGTFHALPFIIPDLNTAVVVASVVVACELVTIAYLRKRFLAVSWRSSLLQVTLGGVLVTAVGFLIGNA
jgi:erythrin-vacuolar iron transport family protein